MNTINENIQPFELELEKSRIRDILDIIKDIEYGFISKIDGTIIKDREWIHQCDLNKYYEVNTNPLITIKNKLGICQDQAIVIKYLMNKYHPDDSVYLYAITKDPKGHCVACYCHNDKWYYIENSWDKEKGLHGYFDSKQELEKYLKFVYYENHKYDTDKNSVVKLQKYPLQKNNVDEDLKDDAKAHFGTTTRWKSCFYINTDGTMLDGSGAKFGARGSNMRTLDHRDIADIIPEGAEGTEAMLAYMAEGNIRFQPEARGFEIMKKPTYEQYETLEKMITDFDDEVNIDIVAENGDVQESFFHDWDEPASKILAQVKRYFVNNEALLEDTCNQLISKSRNADIAALVIENPFALDF